MSFGGRRQVWRCPSPPFPPGWTAAAAAGPGRASPARGPSPPSLSGPSRETAEASGALSATFSRGSMSGPRFSLRRSCPARSARTPLPSPSFGMAAAQSLRPTAPRARLPAGEQGAPGAAVAALLPGCESRGRRSPPGGREVARRSPPARGRGLRSPRSLRRRGGTETPHAASGGARTAHGRRARAFAKKRIRARGTDVSKGVERACSFLAQVLKTPGWPGAAGARESESPPEAPVSADAYASGGHGSRGKAAEPRTLSAGASGMASVPGPGVSLPWELSLPAPPWTRPGKETCRVPRSQETGRTVFPGPPSPRSRGGGQGGAATAQGTYPGAGGD